MRSFFSRHFILGLNRALIVLWLLLGLWLVSILVIVGRTLHVSGGHYGKQRISHMAAQIGSNVKQDTPFSQQQLKGILKRFGRHKPRDFVMVFQNQQLVFISKNAPLYLRDWKPPGQISSGWLTLQNDVLEFKRGTHAPSGTDLVFIHSHHLRKRHFWWVLLLMLSMALLGAVFVLLLQRSLRKVLGEIHMVNQEVSRRGGNNLNPLELRTPPTEMRQIVLAVNHLLMRLKEALRRERLFSRNAAHELRGPLAGIRVQLEAMQIGSQDAHIHQQKALQGVDCAALVVSQLLALLRAEAGGKGNVAELDLACLLLDMKKKYQLRAVEQRVRMRFHTQGLARMRIRRFEVETLASNLIENAFNYGKSKVHVRAVVQKSALIFTVEDDGPGLDDAHFAQACKHFERLDAPTGSGSGLGLAIVRELVQANQWHWEHGRSKALGGLKVCVTLSPQR